MHRERFVELVAEALDGLPREFRRADAQRRTHAVEC